MLPLEDVTVITLEYAVAVPVCTRPLADVGASAEVGRGKSTSLSREGGRGSR